jgi:hypothetical protein
MAIGMDLRSLPKLRLRSRCPELSQFPQALHILILHAAALLKPIGDFEIDLVYSLDSVVEGLNSLGRLEVGLRESGGFSWAVAWDAQGASMESKKTYQHGRILRAGEVIHD